MLLQMKKVPKAILAILAAMTMVVTTEAMTDHEVEVHLVKRVNERGKHSTSEQNIAQRTQSDTPQSHASIQSKFNRSLHRNLEIGSLRGILHTEVRADPISNHRFPITSVQEGQKGGKIISTFMSHPNGGEETIQGNNPLHVHVGEVGIVRGSDIFLNSPSVARFTDGKHQAAKKTFQYNLALSNANGNVHKSKTSYTVADIPHAEQQYPYLRIDPGRESGHIMSMFVRPNSPGRPVSPPDHARSPESANLIGTLESNHQGQQSGRKRGRDQHSISPSGRHGSPPLDLDLKLGLK